MELGVWMIKFNMESEVAMKITYLLVLMVYTIVCAKHIFRINGTF